jgi:NitT/TauT family transport system permease protein
VRSGFPGLKDKNRPVTSNIESVEANLSPGGSMRFVQSAWRRSAIIVAIGVIWEASTRLNLIDPLFLPPLSAIFSTFVDMIRSGEFFDHLVPSLHRALEGFFLAAVLGVPLGCAFGWSRRGQEYFGTVIEILRPVPPISLIPLAILWLGIGDLSKIGIIAWACFWPIFLNSILGVQSINPILIKSAAIMEIRGVRFFLQIVLPASLPQIFTGLRISLAISLIVLVATEMIGADRGLGYLILEGERTFQSPRMFVGIFSIAIIGYLLNEMLLTVERFLFRYKA